MNRKKTNHLIIGIILLIIIGSSQIISHFIRVKYNTDGISLPISIINSVMIPLFLIFIYLYVKGATNKTDLSFTIGIIFIFIMAMLLITSHYLQNIYYSNDPGEFAVFGFQFQAHFIVDLVIYSIIGVFIILLYLFINSRRY